MLLGRKNTGWAFTPSPPLDLKLRLCGGLFGKLVSLGEDLHTLSFWTRNLSQSSDRWRDSRPWQCATHTAHRTRNLLDLKLRLCGGLLGKLVSLGEDLHTLSFWTRNLSQSSDRWRDSRPWRCATHTAHRTRNLLQNVGGETKGFLPFCPD